VNLLKVLPSGSVREQNADCAGDLGFYANRIAGMSAWEERQTGISGDITW
jgi:hypothetical protein